MENMATTFLFPSTVRVHVGEVPLQSPPQPTNILPDLGVAVRVTWALAVNATAWFTHPVPQLNWEALEGLLTLVTVP